MKLVQCENGHYFDADQYDQCPQCNPELNKNIIDETVPLGANHDETVTLSKSSSLGEIIDNVSVTVNNYDETVPFYANNTDTRLVVGWLVCIKGPNKGMSFNLYHGKNYIGRAHESDVVLDKDKSVSRLKHAIIVYDPMAKVFIAVPGESRELYYLNKNIVLSNELLKAYDKINIGASELLFVPLCNDKFDWDDVNE